MIRSMTLAVEVVCMFGVVYWVFLDKGSTYCIAICVKYLKHVYALLYGVSEVLEGSFEDSMGIVFW